MKIKIKRLENVPMPRYAYADDAAFDLYSAENYILAQNNYHVFSTGLAIQIPKGYVGLLNRKSGLANKGISVLGTGVIDAGYCGEIKVAIQNIGISAWSVSKWDKIAQISIVPVMSVEFEEVEEFEESDRGTNGFGSTGR